LTSSAGSEAGVGRFAVEGRNLVMLHDVTVNVLYGPDMERIKSLCRGENTVVKVHSTTATIPAVFVLVTSNERLHLHSVPSKKGSNNWSLDLPSHTLATGKKRVHPENIRALQYRFLEMTIRKPCQQEESDLRKSDSFEKRHMILGLYLRVLETLEKYTAADFCSEYLYRYVIGGLEKNALLFKETFGSEAHYLRLLNLKVRYGLHYK